MFGIEILLFTLQIPNNEKDIFSAFVPRIRQSYGRIGCLKYSTGAPAGEGKETGDKG
jgi:hypothetical protein